MASEWVPAGYELIELLGFGTCGEVWRGREVATGEPVAVKRLREDTDTGALVGRLHRLAVESPHVVPVKAILSGPGGVALVTAYAAGGSLATLLRVRGRLTPGETVTVVLPLAQTLAELHAQGVVHGAVSPSNILFTANGRPLLADLGLAEVLRAAGPDPRADRRAVPADDVRDLAQVCVQSLRGVARPEQEPTDGAAAALLEAAAAVLAEPGSAAAFAEAVAACGPPAAVQLVPAAELGRESPRQERGTASSVRAAAGAGWSRRAGRSDAADTSDAAQKSDGAGRSDAVDGPGAAETMERAAGGDASGLSGSLAVSAAPANRRGPRRVPRRSVAVAGVGLAGLGLAALLGVAWAAAAGPGPGASALPGPAVHAAAGPRAAPSAGADVTPSASGTPGAGPARSTGGSAGPVGAGGTRGTGPSIGPAATDWASVLGALDSRRAGAFGLLDASLLTQVYAPGAPPLAVDRAALRRLAAAGVHAVGLDLQVDRVAVRSAGPRSAVLDVVDRLPAYDLATGPEVVQRQPGRGPTSWRIRLVSGAGGWRIADIRPGSGVLSR